MENCQCGTGRAYLNCCGKFISGDFQPTTPEELMRSRYTAYTQANIPYIAKTMRSPAADNFDGDNAYAWAKAVKWSRLEVLKISLNSSIGFVEFRAYFYENNQKRVIHENSEFHLIDGIWFYINGDYTR
jgi:SEC-C motif-containing protein